MTHSQSQAKFSLGHIVVTTNASQLLTQEEIDTAIDRHAQCDWGDIPVEDASQNESAIIRGGRLFSSYGSDERRCWVITEADRSVTTVLLPLDY